MQIQISWLLRSQLNWIYTVCKSKAYPGSAGPELSFWVTEALLPWMACDKNLMFNQNCFVLFFIFIFQPYIEDIVNNGQISYSVNCCFDEMVFNEMSCSLVTWNYSFTIESSKMDIAAGIVLFCFCFLEIFFCCLLSNLGRKRSFSHFIGQGGDVQVNNM